jgi:3-hydroxybutyrate dehydrogenase
MKRNVDPRGKTPMKSSQLGILITGAGSGVGRGLAQCLVGMVHHLFLADVRLELVEETIRSIGGDPCTVSAHAFDVTSSRQVREFLQSIGDARIDVLVNNAGLQEVCAIEQFPEEKWDTLIDVMLKGPFLLTQALLPAMRQRGFGRIINIGSIHSLVASPFKSAYVAAKHGLLGLSKVVALESAGQDITINTICPAYVRTPMVDAQISAQAREHGMSEQEVIEKIMLAPMPKKAFITVEEIAATVEFLMSENARNITGQTIVIDGGWTAR